LNESAKKLTILWDYTENINSSVHPPVAGPEWSSPNTSLPCAFASDTKPRITAKFEGCPMGTVYAKGDGPSSFDLPVKLLSNGIYEATELSTKFIGDKIYFFENFEIKWYFAATPNGPWMEAGTSINPLYVIKPTMAPTMDFYHTLLYYGCKYGNGKTTDLSVVDNIYNNVFVPKKLLRRDDPAKLDGMSYWGLDNPQTIDYCWTTPALLRYEDGRCGAWAVFFQDMLKVQGIFTELGALSPKISVIDENSVVHYEFINKAAIFFGSEKINLSIEYKISKFGVKYLNGCFFVKNWQLSSNLPFYLWDKEYKPYGTPLGPISLNNGNLLLKSEMFGVIAQNNENPQSTFVDHAVLLFEDGIYDPSYGIQVPSGGLNQTNYEQIAVQGYGIAEGQLKFFKIPYPVFRTSYLLEEEITQLQLKMEKY